MIRKARILLPKKLKKLHDNVAQKIKKIAHWLIHLRKLLKAAHSIWVSFYSNFYSQTNANTNFCSKFTKLSIVLSIDRWIWEKISIVKTIDGF